MASGRHADVPNQMMLFPDLVLSDLLGRLEGLIRTQQLDSIHIHVQYPSQDQYQKYTPKREVQIKVNGLVKATGHTLTEALTKLLEGGQ